MPTAPPESGNLTPYGPYNTGGFQLPNEYGLNYPNYVKILEMLMAPYKKMEEERLLALKGQTDAQMELARRANSLTMSDLDEQRAQARRNLQNALASAGLTDSGAKDYQLTKTDHSFSRLRQNAANSLEAQLLALANSLANAQLASTQGLQQQQLALLPQVQQTYQPTNVYSGPVKTTPYGAFNASPLNLPGRV